MGDEGNEDSYWPRVNVISLVVIKTQPLLNWNFCFRNCELTGQFRITNCRKKEDVLWEESGM